MSKIYNNVLDLIGNTPILKADKLKEKLKIENNEILLKLEMFNPGGSIKDRPSKEMILSAMEKGLINNETVIIEPTSGNTGIGISMICQYLGLKVIIVMPDNFSNERIKLLKAYGAEVILTEGAKGMQGSLDKVEELCKEYKNHFIPMQFSNSDNPLSHYKTTAEEIIKDTNGKIDYLIAGIGTGGTISGIGRKLKQFNENIKVIGVEPEDSPLITKGYSGYHALQGIGANFIPDNLDLKCIDKVITVNKDEAYKCVKELLKNEGILAGISSGACIAAMMKLVEEEQLENKIIVCILPDRGERYLSTDLFE